MEDPIRETQPEGALTPPPRVPPVALATATPEPPREPRDVAAHKTRARAIVDGLLDGLDSVADRIAHAVGLR